MAMFINVLDVSADKRLCPSRPVPLDDLTETEFFHRYRFSKDSFRRIVDIFRMDLEHPTKRSNAISAELQLCVALRFYATGSFLEVIGDTVCTSKASVSRIVDRVTSVICARLSDFVKFPNNVLPLQSGFHNIARMPGIVGAVDGTHVRIVAPSGDQEPYYVNRKGYHSVNAQFICDSRNRFLNVVADWPGSVHDSRIFAASNIAHEFASGIRRGILLGDSGYACTSFVLTPVMCPASAAQ